MAGELLTPEAQEWIDRSLTTVEEQSGVIIDRSRVWVHAWTAGESKTNPEQKEDTCDKP
jgi:hypothetical protein